MKGLVVSDSGPIFSLAVVKRLDILDNLFEDILIPKAVWNEITRDKTIEYYNTIYKFFQHRVIDINNHNDLELLMDYGESEAVSLYREKNADYLLIDDKKARTIAEHLGIKCIGTLGILVVAKQNNIIDKLRPIFISFIKNNRYYSIELLNKLLILNDEEAISL